MDTINKIQILSLKPGKELDKIVAMNIFKEYMTFTEGKNGKEFVITIDKGTKNERAYWEEFWEPSTIVQLAFVVVDELHRRGDCLSLSYTTGLFQDDFNRFGYIARFRRYPCRYGISENAAEAICKAALLTLVEVKAK